MARERLVEQCTASSSYIKKIPLNESTRKIIYEGKEYSPSQGFEFPIWRLEKENKNGRIYSRKLAERIVKENKTTVGLADHPSEEGSVKDICFIEKNPSIKKDTNGDEILYCQVFLVGPHGKGTVKDILEIDGGAVGLSSSCFGEVGRNKYVIEDSVELERYCDHVLSPSGDVFGTLEDAIAINESVKEDFSFDKLNVEDEVTFDEKKWRIEKIDNEQSIELTDANNTGITRVVTLEDLKKENIMNESRDLEQDKKGKWWIKDGSNIINGPYDSRKDAEGEQYKREEMLKIKEEFVQSYKGYDILIDTNLNYNIIKNNNFIKSSKSLDDAIKIIDNLKEGIMNKKFSVEEKTFRLSIKNLLKEAEAKEDPQEKLDALEDIKEWFEDTEMAPDLEKDVDAKIESAETEISDLAKKGMKTDSLEVSEKNLKEALDLANKDFKTICEKYEVAADLLDNLKIYSKRMTELYDNQKARANGMVEAKIYNEAMKYIDKVKLALIEKDEKIKVLESSVKTLNESLSKVQTTLNEKIKFDSFRTKQIEATEQYKKIKEDEAEEKKAEDDKKAAEVKEAEDKEKDINVTEDEEVKDYYDKLEKQNEDYKKYKTEILSKKTLLEAQIFVMKLDESVNLKTNKIYERKLTEEIKKEGGYKLVRESRPSSMRKIDKLMENQFKK
jgi:hypothetical protein